MFEKEIINGFSNNLDTQTTQTKKKIEEGISQREEDWKDNKIYWTGGCQV